MNQTKPILLYIYNATVFTPLFGLKTFTKVGDIFLTIVSIFWVSENHLEIIYIVTDAIQIKLKWHYLNYYMDKLYDKLIKLAL